MASVSFKDLGTTSVSGTTASDVPVVMENHATDLVGHAHVSAIGAGTSLVITVQHSADATNWLTLKAFSAITTTGYYQLQITEHCLPHVRTTSTCTGGTTTATHAARLYYRSA